jgi:hypothetical protein
MKTVEKLIEAQDYTDDIVKAIADIKNVMDNTLVEYSDKDIQVFQYGNIVYILANPQLGTEPVFDEVGRIKEMVPLRNITLIYPEDWLSFEGNKIKYKMPRLRIMRPELCARIVYES